MGMAGFSAVLGLSKVCGDFVILALIDSPIVLETPLICDDFCVFLGVGIRGVCFRRAAGLAFLATMASLFGVLNWRVFCGVEALTCFPLLMVVFFRVGRGEAEFLVLPLELLP